MANHTLQLHDTGILVEVDYAQLCASKKRPKLNYAKCRACRNDKKACERLSDGQKCERCLQKRWPCSLDEVKHGRARTRRENRDEVVIDDEGLEEVLSDQAQKVYCIFPEEGLEDTLMTIRPTIQPAASSAPQNSTKVHARPHLRTNMYFCPLHLCLQSLGGKGFAEKIDLDKHMLEHTKTSLTCTIYNSQEQNFSSKVACDKHNRTEHAEIDCPNAVPSKDAEHALLILEKKKEFLRDTYLLFIMQDAIASTQLEIGRWKEIFELDKRTDTYDYDGALSSLQAVSVRLSCQLIEDITTALENWSADELLASLLSQARHLSSALVMDLGKSNIENLWLAQDGNSIYPRVKTPASPSNAYRQGFLNKYVHCSIVQSVPIYPMDLRESLSLHSKNFQNEKHREPGAPRLYYGFGVMPWRDVLGRSKIHIACQQNAPFLVLECIKDKWKKTKSGLLPLHIAAAHGTIKCIDILQRSQRNGVWPSNPLVPDPSILAIDEYQRTALSYAAMNGHGSAVELLLQKDQFCLTPIMPDIHGKKPVDFAVQNKYVSLVKILTRSGSTIEMMPWTED